MNYLIVLISMWIHCAVSVTAEQQIDYGLDLKAHLAVFNNFRHPLEPYSSNRATARSYVTKKFKEFGLRFTAQEFESEIASHDNDIIKEKGMNLIGELGMKSNATSPVILIGANYDSSVQRNPLMENGCALAALLEILKGFQLIINDRKMVLNCTVLFVAFDINSKAYVPQGPGAPGSTHFVENFLEEYLSDREFLGAIILDSISNFNQARMTQLYFDGFQQIFPDAYSKIESGGAKGDFLAIVTRGDESNRYLSQLFVDSYEAVKEPAPRLQELVIKDGSRLTPNFVNQMRKHSHAAFWKASFPSILLTDMDITRTPPDGAACRSLCNVDKFWTESRQILVEKTVKTVIQMLVDLQTVEPEYTMGRTTQPPQTTTTSGVVTTNKPWFMVNMIIVSLLIYPTVIII